MQDTAPIEFADMTEGRLVTLAPGSTAVWRILGTGTSEAGEYVVLEAVKMDGYTFRPGGNTTPRSFPSVKDVTLFPYEGGA